MRMIAAALAVCLPLQLATGTARAEPPPGYRLVFAQDFAGAEAVRPLDPTVWTAQIGTGAPETPGWGNGELEYYTDAPANLFIDGGQLHLKAVLDDPARPDGRGPTSARILSRKGVLGVYGYLEIRASLPCGKGAWPALWMLGADGSWPQRGEIDIAEWSGRLFTDHQIQAALHMPAHYGDRPILGRTTLASACGAFHVFKLQWTPDEIRIAVDGPLDRPELVYRKPPRATPADWPYDQAPQLLLNVAVGGALGGPVDPNAGVFEMKVDYIRYYQTAD